MGNGCYIFGVVSDQICNLVYPQNIQEFLKTNPGILSIKNVVHQCGNKLLDGSPILKDLLENVKLYSLENQLIFTKYDSHHGLELLREFLINNNIKVYCILPTFNQQLIDNEINLFNSDISGSKLLLTSFSNFQNVIPRNIHQIHVFDGGFDNIEKLILTIYKYQNYNDTPSLTIHYYISQSRNNQQPRADTVLYEKHSQKLEEDIKLFNELSLNGNEILKVNDK